MLRMKLLSAQNYDEIVPVNSQQEKRKHDFVLFNVLISLVCIQETRVLFKDAMSDLLPI